MKKRYLNHRERSLFWKPFPARFQMRVQTSQAGKACDENGALTRLSKEAQQNVFHPLVDEARNKQLRDYELQSKQKFDRIKEVIRGLSAESDLLKNKNKFIDHASKAFYSVLKLKLPENIYEKTLGMQPPKGFQYLYSQAVFEQFIRFSEDFYKNDPLGGLRTAEARKIFRKNGFHAVGIAPCADGRLAHVVSYVLRLPYDSVRRKAHAGALFDISESVRNWVFIEHSRFRNGIPNHADEPTRYLKIAIYHYSEIDPEHLGCAAHGSNEHKAASEAHKRLLDFKEAIENRFGCGASVNILLLGLNTDDDNLRVHVPDNLGKISLDRFVSTKNLYEETVNLSKEDAIRSIQGKINREIEKDFKQPPGRGMLELITWLIINNFQQIQYVKQYEGGSYKDLGHEERFLGIGSNFDEVQLRNLTYYSFLDTIEEGVEDVDVGIKIFKKLNVKNGLPIPIVIRREFDGRVPGSKERAEKKLHRLNKALHERYSDLSEAGLLHSMLTLKDNSKCQPVEIVESGG